MNPAQFLVTVALLVFTSVALAGVEFRPLPAGLTVQVTSTTPRATPTVQQWIVSNRTLIQADSITFSAFVIDCSGCTVLVHLCKNSDLTQCNIYANSVYVSVPLPNSGGGWFNGTLAAHSITPGWPRGTYYLSVVLSTAGLYNSYTSAQMETLFGAGSIYLSDWPVLNMPLVVVDRCIIAHNTPTSFSDLFSVSIHFTGPAAVTYLSLYFTPTGVGFVGAMALGGVVTDGWFNATLTLGDLERDGAVQSVPYMPYALVALDAVNTQYRLLPSDFQTALGFMPTLTPTGAVFSPFRAAPHCNFTFAMGPLSVDSAAQSVALHAVCDGSLPLLNTQWFLAGPAAMRFDGGSEQAFRQVGTSASIPQNALAGMYSVHAIWVSDQNGNIAVYSNSMPPLLTSQWLAQSMDEGWAPNDEINRVFAAAGEGTTSGAHAVRGVGGGPLAVVCACAAFAVVALRLL